MQSLLFVFIGLPPGSGAPSLPAVGEAIENRAKEIGIGIDFDKKDHLLKGRLNNVGFYVSFVRKEELNDWYTMAKNFELMLERKPMTKPALIKRYNKLKASKKNQYQDVHFKLAEVIFDEMEKLPGISIYTFQ